MSAYDEALNVVRRLASANPEVEPAVIGYMAARAALLLVAAVSGNERAAEIAYKLADELAMLTRNG